MQRGVLRVYFTFYHPPLTLQRLSRVPGIGPVSNRDNDKTLSIVNQQLPRQILEIREEGAHSPGISKYFVSLDFLRSCLNGTTSTP